MSAPSDPPIEPPGGTGASNLRRHAAKGVFWTATSNWADQIARLIVFVILSRLLEPEAFGLVALAWVFIGLTEIIADQGLADAIVQRKQIGPRHLDTAFWMSMALGLGLAVVLAALAVPIAAGLDQDSLAPVLGALCLAIPIGSSNLVQRAVLTREMAFRSLAIRTMIATVVGSIAGVAAALLGLGVWSLVAQRLITQSTGTIVLWRVSSWRPHFRFDSADARSLFAFGKHVVGFRLLNYFNANADNLLIGAVLGPVALGFYTVGYRILRLVIQLTSNLIDRVAFPLYSRLQDDHDRFRRAYYKSSAFAALIAFPVFTWMIVMAPEIVAVLFGPKWKESVPVMQVLSLLGLVRAVSYLNSSTLTALGKPSWRVVIVGITAILNVAAFAVVVTQGIVAVAVAAVCVGYLVAPMSYWAVNRLVPISARTYLKGVRGPLAASILFAGATLGLQHLLGGAGALVTLVIASSVGAIVYLAAIQILARPVAAEARNLARHALPYNPFASGGRST